MNTQNLIKENQQIYQTFFNNYDLVISTPINFPIIGDTSIYSQGNSSILLQKLTLRNYIGINFKQSNERKKIIYKKNGKFEETFIDNIYPLDNEKFKDIGLDYEIGFLSEYNWNDPPSVIANIIISKLLIENQISLDDLIKLDLNNPDYETILNKIINLDKILLEENHFFSNIRNNSMFYLGGILKSKSHILILEKNSKLQIKNIGKSHNYNQLDMSISFLNPNSYIQNNYNPRILNEKNEQLKKYLKHSQIDLKTNQDTNLLSGLEIISNHYAIKTHQTIHEMCNGVSPTALFNDLYSYRQVIRSIFSDFSSNKIDVKQIKNNFISLIGDKNFKIYVDVVGVSGPSRIVLFTNKTTAINDELIQNINNTYGLNLSLDYSSYHDGYEIEGSKVEQYKSKGIKSSLCSGNIVKSYINNDIHLKNDEMQNIIQKEKEGIILDKLSKKIYINGKKLTSKDLHSQSFTIDMIELLIDNLGKEINNKLLPLSTYSKNKNEMIGKIVLPLKKIIETKTGKKFPIECRGSLSEFNIKLTQNNLKITIIRQ